MRRMNRVFSAALLLTGLISCGQQNLQGGISAEASSCGETAIRCRIADGSEEGELLLASLDPVGGIYRLTVGRVPVTIDGKLQDAGDLTDGMEMTVTYSGAVKEGYPAEFESVTALDARTPPGGSCYDLCGFYLNVLEDLWDKDPGLNEDLTYIGVDLSKAPGGLTDSEKEAIAWRFAELHGCMPLTGTYDQLAEQGYIDRDSLYWKDGMLFSISRAGAGDERYSLTVLRFNAQKWRSGDGADFFNDCAAVWPEFGTWAGYSVDSRAIS